MKMKVNMNRKSNMNVLQHYINEMKLSIQQLEYEIEESNKTKDPNKSLLSNKRGVLEIIGVLNNELVQFIEELKNGLTYEQLRKLEDELEVL